MGRLLALLCAVVSCTTVTLAKPGMAQEGTPGDGGQILLSDQGVEPHALYRYDLSSFAAQAMQVEWTETRTLVMNTLRIDKVLPRLLFRIGYMTPELDSSGQLRLGLRWLGAEALDTPGVDAQNLSDYQSAFPLIDFGDSAEITVTDRGAVRGAEVTVNGALVEAFDLMMLLVSRSMRPVPPLPAEPIGIGAVWEASHELLFLGLSITERFEYRLASVDGNVLALEFTVVRTTNGRSSVLPDGVESASLVATDYEGGGTGRVSVTLDSFRATWEEEMDATAQLSTPTTDGAFQELMQVEVETRVTMSPRD